MRVGLPELIVVFMIGLVWIVPVVAGIWALVTLHRIRTTQEEMGSRLASIERSIQAVRPG